VRREGASAAAVARSPAGLRARLIALVRWIRSPDLGLLGQGMRYVIAGGAVMCVYLTTTLVLSDVAHAPFQIALAIGFVTALVVHFTLQRFFVWVHHDEFAMPLHHQLGRYLTLALIQYGTTAAGTDLLPRAVGAATIVVYLGIMIIWIMTNFLLYRYRIFHAGALPSGTD
jgi:putative flippase GtrA